MGGIVAACRPSKSNGSANLLEKGWKWRLATFEIMAAPPLLVEELDSNIVGQSGNSGPGSGGWPSGQEGKFPFWYAGPGRRAGPEMLGEVDWAVASRTARPGCVAR